MSVLSQGERAYPALASRSLDSSIFSFAPMHRQSAVIFLG